MDSPIEKWNLIIGNLALKQVSGLYMHLQILSLGIWLLPVRMIEVEYNEVYHYFSILKK